MGDKESPNKRFKSNEDEGPSSFCFIKSGNEDPMEIISDDDVNISNDSSQPSEELITSDENDKVMILSDDSADGTDRDEKLKGEMSKCISQLFPSTSKDTTEEVPKTLASTKTKVTKTIEGVNVALPLEPYGCQVALMSKIIMAIKRKEHCILESPTGSGKTLALLSGALAWQHKEKEIINKQREQTARKNAPIDLENLDCLFFDDGNVVKVPKIYYGARTHSQLKQVIAEFKRTPYCGEGGARMTILSSREQTCVRIYDQAQWTSKNDMCQKCIKPKKDQTGSNCKYFDNRDELTFLFSTRDAFDLDELKAAGEEKDSCPYYVARSLSKHADIIFCPYNYLIDPNIKERLDIKLKDNIVIIDEAHNIENICRDAQTYEIIWANVEKACEEMEKSNRSYNKFIFLESILNNWKKWFNNHASLVKNENFTKTWETQHFIESLDNHNIGSNQLAELLEQVRNLENIYQVRPETLYGITELTVTLLGTIAGALNDILNHKTEYKPKLQLEGGFLKSLKLDCLNPALAMKHMSEARCIALASGTLSPLESLFSELGTDFKHKVSLNHVISRDRVWIGTLVKDIKGNRIQCTAGKMDDSLADTLGQAILQVCRVTPHGVLCVLPAYYVLDRFMERWDAQGILYELEQLKHVHKESKRNHERVMEKYFRDVETSKGAILFAVHRGKVSEGIDLKDNQARCVICVGIPYPNLGEAEAKRDYNKKYCKERGLLSGSEWYDIQAFRTLNQAVGRCVRHRQDWGAVLLVDSRFLEPRHRAKLSKWVQNYMEAESYSMTSLFSDEPRSLKSFMEKLSANN